MRSSLDEDQEAGGSFRISGHLPIDEQRSAARTMLAKKSLLAVKVRPSSIGLRAQSRRQDATCSSMNRNALHASNANASQCGERRRQRDSRLRRSDGSRGELRFRSKVGRSGVDEREAPRGPGPAADEMVATRGDDETPNEFDLGSDRLWELPSGPVGTPLRFRRFAPENIRRRSPGESGLSSRKGKFGGLAGERRRGSAAAPDEKDKEQASKKQKTDGGNPSPKSVAGASVVDAPLPASNYNEEKDELGGHHAASGIDRVGKIEIKMKIPHDGEVNRARHDPRNHFVVATRGPGKDAYVWDLSRHASFPPEGKGDVSPDPQVVLRGHEGEGYGVAWCSAPGTEGEGRLVTCAEDGNVCLWNVCEALNSGKSGVVVRPEAVLKRHADVVEDVDWHNRDANMVGSCGDDRLVCLWDVREGKREKPVHVVEGAHGGDVNSLEFHPVNEFLFATGGSDKVVKLWDMRNLKRPLQTLEGHTDQVFAVHWSPHDESVLASCSADRRIALWDLSRIGAEQTPEDAEDGPPELLFLHGGHTSKVNDFSWNPGYDWCLAGVSEDNVLQVWSPAEDVYAEEGDDEVGEEGGGKKGEGDLATSQRTEILGDDELE
ncbi:hypothetical protein ACHAWF_015142 [Thalassiosira exigua]